jgi:hypothetical protein
MREQRRCLDVRALENEFARVTLSDRRLERRALKIVAAIAPAPSDSFPEQMASEAEREALYRFLSNPRVTMHSLLAGHVDATHERMRGRDVVRVIHDTSTFRFAGDREGLGVVRGDVRGFFGHVALAIAGDETREPLGVLAVTPFIHDDAVVHRGMPMSERIRESKAKPRAEKESSRWERQAIEVSKDIPEETHAVHVMDREADDYVLFGELQRAGISFVVRVTPQRRTKPNRVPANDLLAEKPATLFRTVRLTSRPSQRRNRINHPAREDRDAELQIRWGRVTLGRTDGTPYDTRELALNAVHVFEPNPPPGEEPVEWMLFTSERVESLDDATQIVDHYRARWVVEEYFKALKSGCAFEKRQLTSYDGLTKALALFVPIAWHLLLLRHLGRASPARAASAVFDAEQLLLLRTLLEQRRYEFPARPEVRDALLGIAALGGHIKNNGTQDGSFSDADSLASLKQRPRGASPGEVINLESEGVFHSDHSAYDYEFNFGEKRFCVDRVSDASTAR